MRICNFLPGGLICLAALAAPLCHAAQFVIGQVAPLSGLDAGQARAYSTGLQMYLNQVNKTGGINGNTFALARKDDSGRSEDTVSATRELQAESRPLVLSGYFGNRNMAALLASGLLEKEKVPLVGYRSSEVGPATPLVYSVRAGLGSKVTREALASALDSMDRYDLGGYQVAFQPGMRSGSRFVELSIVSSSGRIRQ